MTYKEREELYKSKQEAWKSKIKSEPNKWKRFWKWIWFFIAFPWVWTWQNIQDWRTAVIFVICFLVISSEVWVPYLIYFITKNAWWLGIGSACWLFWLGPGTPFMLLCVACTAGVKAIFNKLISRKERNNEQRRDFKNKKGNR